MNKTDQKVKEYLDRAKDILDSMYGSIKYDIPSIIEIAKMIQIEEHSESKS